MVDANNTGATATFFDTETNQLISVTGLTIKEIIDLKLKERIAKALEKS